MNLKQFLLPAFENKKFIFMLALKSILRNLIEFGWIETARRCVLAIEQKDIESLKIYAIIGIGVTLAGTIWQFTLKQYGKYGIWIMFKTIYSYIYQRITRVDPQIYEEKGSGKVSTIITEGSVARAGIIDRVVDEGIMFIISFGVALGYIYNLLGIYYALGGIILVSIFTVYVRYFEKKYQQPRKERNQTLQEMSRHRLKVVMHKQDILINNKEIDESIKQSKYLDKLIQQTKKIILYVTYQNIGLDIRSYITYGLYFYLGLNIIQGNFSISALTTIILVINNIFSQISTLTTIRQELSDNKFKFKTMIDFLHGPQIIGYEGGKELENSYGDIRFNKVDFQYSNGSTIFNELTITFEGMKKTALVGSSGAGKSTLIKLIAGYLYPSKGNIYIGNQALPNKENETSGDYISLKSYYQHIGYLTQDSSVFDGTIRENLEYGLGIQKLTEGSEEFRKQLLKTSEDSEIFEGSKDDSKYSEILQLAQCQFIYDFKDGLDTEIGEKGIRLSGGQRQRLAIAKIMLKNPHIILLDEPTSALDSFAEEEITKALNNLFIGRTVIIIAHRLQTVKKANRIIVLGENGTIIEEGNHDELVAKGGTYAKMLELQSGF